VKRRVEAEHLLDPGGQQRRVFAQLPVHTRVVDQQRDAVANEVRGGLVAGCQQKCQLRDRTGNRQRCTILQRRRARECDQVVSRVEPSALDLGGQVVEQLQADRDALIAFGADDRGVEGGDEGVGPVAEALGVLGWYTEHAAITVIGTTGAKSAIASTSVPASTPSRVDSATSAITVRQRCR
jgi:hypothetical protein